ncbi:MAG: hypothetical protein L0099_13285, partial [Acidobacteria bacterium]|nr:hypothetical protein [Acidobacteriota bacterium]
RMWLEAHEHAYVLAVSGKEYVWLGWLRIPVIPALARFWCSWVGALRTQTPRHQGRRGYGLSPRVSCCASAPGCKAHAPPAARPVDYAAAAS